MRFRTLALALALSSGLVSLAEAARPRPAVHRPNRPKVKGHKNPHVKSHKVKAKHRKH